MGSTCLDWRATRKIPHSLNHPWRSGTCPTNVYLCLSWLNCPSDEACCPGNMPRCQQQKLLMKKGRLWYRWTAKKRVMLLLAELKTNNDMILRKSLLNQDRFSVQIWHPYPSCSCVDWTITIDCCVLVEVLWHGQAQEDREA